LGKLQLHTGHGAACWLAWRLEKDCVRALLMACLCIDRGLLLSCLPAWCCQHVLQWQLSKAACVLTCCTSELESCEKCSCCWYVATTGDSPCAQA
jgi:hypothetical protein